MHAMQLTPVLPSAAQVEGHAGEYIVHLEIRDGLVGVVSRLHWENANERN